MNKLSSFLYCLLFFILLVHCSSKQEHATTSTFCNPLNLSYRYQLDEPSRREAADPVIVLFQDKYYLFASKSGGYWVSDDLTNWRLIIPTGLPIEDYAPAAIAINGRLYYTAFNSGAIYSTQNPDEGIWTKVADTPNYPDPALFLDDDGRLYMYYGCSNNGPISVQELDPITFATIGESIECFRPDYENRGWEVFGDENLGGEIDGGIQYSPWDEGPWMNKVNGIYYLQYAAPGTQWKSYADGVYVAQSPTGPFTYSKHSPFAHKPTGFITGAGHGCTFQDKNQNYWHIGTMVISVQHMFERRLGLFPVRFENEHMITNTILADFPQFVPQKINDQNKNQRPDWMLLSYKKEVIASSAEDNYPPAYAVDEEVRTWWSALTGNTGEWLVVNLDHLCDVYAIQINFADFKTDGFGRNNNFYHQYRIFCSTDGQNWDALVDKSNNKQDIPHDYIQLPHSVNTQYLKIENSHMPAHGRFALSGFRIFGISGENPPSAVRHFKSTRSKNDPRKAVITWDPVPETTGYVVVYGIKPGQMLFNNYQVFDKNEIHINSLNADSEYFYTIFAFNEFGTSQWAETKKMILEEN